MGSSDIGMSLLAALMTRVVCEVVVSDGSNYDFSGFLSDCGGQCYCCSGGASCFLILLSRGSSCC
jgi:hypothetical protein